MKRNNACKESIAHSGYLAYSFSYYVTVTTTILLTNSLSFSLLVLWFLSVALPLLCARVAFMEPFPPHLSGT